MSDILLTAAFRKQYIYEREALMVKFQAAGNEILRLGTHPCASLIIPQCCPLALCPERDLVKKHTLYTVLAHTVVKEEPGSDNHAQTSAQGIWTWLPPA